MKKITSIRPDIQEVKSIVATKEEHIKVIAGCLLLLGLLILIVYTFTDLVIKTW